MQQKIKQAVSSFSANIIKILSYHNLNLIVSLLSIHYVIMPLCHYSTSAQIEKQFAKIW